MLKKISRKRRGSKKGRDEGQGANNPTSNTESPRSSSSFEEPSSPTRPATTLSGAPAAGAPSSTMSHSRQGSAAGAGGVDPLSSSVISHFELPVGHPQVESEQQTTSSPAQAAQLSAMPASISSAPDSAIDSGFGTGSASASGSGSGSGGSSTVLAPRDVLQGQQQQQSQLQQASDPTGFQSFSAAAAATDATAPTADVESRLPQTTSRESAEDPITVATGNATGMPRFLPRHRREEQQGAEDASQTGVMPHELEPAVQHHHPAAYSHDDEKHMEEDGDEDEEEDAASAPAAAATPSAPPPTGSLTRSIFAPGISPLRRATLLLASLAINIGLPFVNGVALGFGEIFARTFVAPRLGFSLGINTMAPLPHGGRDGRSPVVNRMDAAEQEAMYNKARQEQQKGRR